MYMTKKIATTILLACLTTAAWAQDDEGEGFSSTDAGNTPGEKYRVETNSFWSNWFVSAGLASTSFYSNQEHNLALPAGPAEDIRANIGAALALGKWFTPSIGLRTKLNGIWGRTVNTKSREDNASKYWTLHEHILVNLSNMLKGYNPNRRWSLIPYIGAGVSRNMTYDTYAIGLSAGLLNTVKVAPRLAVHLDLGYGVHEPDFDGVAKGGTRMGIRSKDQTLSLEVGITYNLDRKGFRRATDTKAVDALSELETDALKAQLEDAKAENARLQRLLEEKQAKE